MPSLFKKNTFSNKIIFPEYTVFFDDFDEVDPIDLIRNIPTSLIMLMMSWMSRELHVNYQDFSKQENYLYHWLGAFEEKEKLSLIKKYIHIKTSNPLGQLTIFSNERILIFSKFCLANYCKGIVETPININQVSKDAERRIFKAFLIISQKNDARYSSAIKNMKNYKGIEHIYSGTWPVLINQHSFEKIKSFSIESIQAYMLFKYFESSSIFSDYINEYYMSKNIRDGSHYIILILNVYYTFVNKENVCYCLKVDKSHLDMRSLLDGFSINYEDNPSISFENKGYKEIREKPVFKINDDSYIILNYNLFLDKLYRGIKFDFFKYGESHNLLNRFNKDFKEFKDFKSMYSDLFSEKTMFYEVIDYCFKNNRNIVKVNGSLHQYEYSDYYIRDGKYIYLFEFKDVIINDNTKFSINYEKIKEGIEKSLVRDNGQNKGISQLANIIEKLNFEPFEFDDYIKKGIKNRNITIYPIIVYTEEFFDFPGVNQYLNDRLNSILESKKNDFTIKNLTLINFETLVDLDEFLFDKKIKFKEVIDNYIVTSKTNIKKPYKDIFERLNNLVGFKEVINDFLAKNHIKKSRNAGLFKDIGEKIFTDNAIKD